MQLPFPKPQELWGDYSVRFWSRKDKNLFTLYLSGVSSAIIYSNQTIITRVIKEVQWIIDLARSGLISPSEAIKSVHKSFIFTKEELESIEQECTSKGYIIGEFFSKDIEPSN